MGRGAENLSATSASVKPIESEAVDMKPVSDVESTEESEVSSTALPMVSPEEHANFFSRITFSFLNPLMRLGYSKPLEQADLPPLPSYDDAKKVSVHFSSTWEEEKKNCVVKKKEPSLTRALFWEYRAPLWIGAILQLVTILLQLTSPVFLNGVLQYLSGSRKHFMYDIFGKYFGYYSAAALFVVPTIRSLVEAQFFQTMFRLGVQVKTALVEIVYAKSLRLSNSARQAKSVGEIVTLMQVDTEKVSLTTSFLHTTWSALVQVFANLALLYYYIGWSAFTGFAMLLITIPTQGKIVSLLLAMQRKILFNTGKRVKIINEVLQGMRVVKSYAWEKPFKESISVFREKELDSMKDRVWLRALQMSLMLATPTLIMVVTFAFYSGVANRPMNAAIIFTALSLFNSLRVPLMMYPFVINSVLAGHVSLTRLGKFLQSEEMTPIDREEGEEARQEKTALVVRNASFKWSSIAPPDKRKKGDKKGVKSVGGGGEKGGGAADAKNGQTEEKEGEKGGKKRGWFRKGGKKGENGGKGGGKPGEKKGEEEGKPFELHDISLHVPRGSLVSVVGSVGSGKSSLASALLGEMEKIGGEGSVVIRGSLAFCTQQAWILNASLRENILFGHDFEQDRYDAIVEACALSQDLAALPDGDMTEIGERGINLSGGQKQRVSLARAVYSDTDIVILDDPLSAVDAHVGAHLFDNCVNGVLKGKTIILVTNQLHYVPYSDVILVMKDGRIAEQGTYKDLMSRDSEFSRLMRESGSHVNEEGEGGGEEIRRDGESGRGMARRGSSLGRSSKRDDLRERAISRGRSLGGSKASMRRMDSVTSYTKEGTLVDKENRARGMLALTVYWKYWTETGKLVPLGVLILYLIVQAEDAYQRYWLAFWTKNEYHQGTGFYLGIYAALALFYTLLIYLRTLGQALVGLWIAKLLHAGMLNSVLRAPMSFFDTTPAGRILNRFSADQSAVDETLPFSWSTFLNILFSVLGTIVVICVITPTFIAAFVPMACLYFYTQQIYRKTARELKRLDAVSKSPVYQQFTETLNGLSTIRAYGQEERFLRMCDDKLDANNRASFFLRCCDRWLSVRLELMGNILVVVTALLAVSQKGTLFAGYAGIAIDYALQITASLSMLVRTMTDTENQMNGVERMLEYRENIDHEAPEIVEDNRPPKDWPPKGGIEIEKLSMRYRPGLPLVLKEVSVSISGADRIGVVGRTGSGKSSLMLALFRLVEPSEGRIVIDGIDTSTIGLEDLRSRLSIIPQDPILFSGTLRTNLDPFGRHSDDELWEALEHSHLKNKVSNLSKKLDSEVAEYGENFSVGERQLLCLGRVLLRKSRILVMDEATSSVDFETDRLIQVTIRTYLNKATMLIIAHRINTIIDASRVLVMADGEVAEYDTPSTLLSNQEGKFFSLVQDTGEQSADHLLKVANGELDYFSALSKNGSFKNLADAVALGSVQIPENEEGEFEGVDKAPKKEDGIEKHEKK